VTPNMARCSSQRFASSFRVDGKQFVNARHNRSRNRLSALSTTSSADAWTKAAY
jgi:hypothetical protein